MHGSRTLNSNCSRRIDFVDQLTFETIKLMSNYGMNSMHSVELNSWLDSPNATGTPERRLLLAVLERAILDYVGNDRLEVNEATSWLFGELKDTEIREFSFRWVCSQLDLDATEISGKIRAMPKRGASRIAPWYTSKAYVQAKSKKVSLSLVKGGSRRKRSRIAALPPLTRVAS